MVDGVLVGRARLAGSNNMQFELRSFDLPPTFAYLPFDTLNPDTVKVAILKDVEDGLDVGVELLDSLFFDLFDASSSIGQCLFDLLTFLFEVLTLAEFTFEVFNFVFDFLEIVFEPADFELDLVCFLVLVEDLAELLVFEFVDFCLEVFEFLRDRLPVLFKLVATLLARVDLVFDTV